MEKKMPELSKNLYALRAYHWIHDTLILIGILTLFILFGGLHLIGYQFDIAFIPTYLTADKVVKK